MNYHRHETLRILSLQLLNILETGSCLRILLHENLPFFDAACALGLYRIPCATRSTALVGSAFGAGLRGSLP